jgi:hypothetical protein
MITGSQDAWTFRIVDQDTGAAVPGVPVSVLEEGGRTGGYWVSDVDGVVRIPKHDRARLRLRVGLRNEEMIELDARSLPDEPIPLAAPRDRPIVGGDRFSASAPPPVVTAGSAGTGGGGHAGHGGHVVRFARIALLPQDRDITANPDSTVRYGALLELEQVWQSLGSQAGDTLYSVSLGPGEEVKLVVSDGRWRKKPDASERHLQIVAKMVGSRQLGDHMDVIPLDAVFSDDLATAASTTVRFLAERTGRSGEALQRRPIGITELQGDQPAGTSLRTLRNMRAEGVLTYHFVEPVERYRVIVRSPRLCPALLVPFRLPNIATRDVVRRYGYAIRRSLLDRTLGPDVDEVLSLAEPSAAAERRLYAHIAANLPYYSATIIAAGDPAERFFALAKLRDPQDRPLTDVIENVVVGRVGNYVAFLLRSTEFTTPEWRAALAAAGKAAGTREWQDQTVTLPLPGIWLRSELFPAEVATRTDRAADQEAPDARAGRVPKRRSSDR